jgi:hypothetical protein
MTQARIIAAFAVISSLSLATGSIVYWKIPSLISGKSVAEPTTAPSGTLEEPTGSAPVASSGPLADKKKDIDNPETGKTGILEFYAPAVEETSSKVPIILVAQQQDNFKIPIATKDGILLMTFPEYDDYTRYIGNLPFMSQSYVFGKSIPIPLTDHDGHIRILKPDEIAQLKQNHVTPPDVSRRNPGNDRPSPDQTLQQPSTLDIRAQRELGGIPVATSRGIIWMNQTEYDRHTTSSGHLPALSSSYIFGRTISMPKTDKHGHIHVSDVGSVSPEPPEPDDFPSRTPQLGGGTNKRGATRQPAARQPATKNTGSIASSPAAAAR